MFENFFSELIGGEGKYSHLPRFNLTFDLNYDGIVTWTDWYWAVCYIGSLPVDLIKFFLIGPGSNGYYTFWGGVWSLLIYVLILELIEKLSENIFETKNKRIYGEITSSFGLIIIGIIFIIMPLAVLFY